MSDREELRRLMGLADLAEVNAVVRARWGDLRSEAALEAGARLMLPDAYARTGQEPPR